MKTKILMYTLVLFFGVLVFINILGWTKEINSITAMAVLEENPLSPVLEYKFGDCDGKVARDSSGNGNDGIMEATLTEGYSGAGASFNGVNEYIKINPSPTLNFKDAFSIEFWFRASKQGDFKYLFSKEDAPFSYEIGVDTFQIDHLRFFLATKENGLRQVVIPSFKLDGSWHHFAGTYSGKELAVYLDGKLMKTTSHSGKIKMSSTKGYDDFAIGRFNDDYEGDYFTGKIDEFRLYNYARTSDQIKEDASVSLNPSSCYEVKNECLKKVNYEQIEKNCLDGEDNDCNNEADYDTLDRGKGSPKHGDINCPIEILGISASLTSPCVNKGIDVRCKSSVKDINSIKADVNGKNCDWNVLWETDNNPNTGWNGENIVTFNNCIIDKLGKNTISCSIQKQKSYQKFDDKSITVIAGEC